jgi:uncharacterized membrane protein
LSDPQIPPGRAPRLAAIDIARGVAILAMAVYHFTWDLALYGIVDVDPVADPGWRFLARATASSFLFLVGIGLVLAHRRTIRWPAFWRRFAVIAAAAAAVSLATYLVFGDEFVRFGILHNIALVSLVGIGFVVLPWWLTALAGIAVYLAPAYLAAPFFNHVGWIWLGLSTEVPDSVDYVPLLPWLSAVLFGIAAARLGLAIGADRRLARWQPKDVAARVFGTAGRWSLAIYLVHQPLLFGIVWLLSLAVPAAPTEDDPNVAAAIQNFAQACQTNCVVNGGAAEVCQATCGCLLRGLRERGLLIDAVRRNDGSMNGAIGDVTNACIAEARRNSMEPDFDPGPAAPPSPL